MRIVIDTNIWIAGLLWRGDAWRLPKLAEQEKVELCIASMLLELEEVLAYERFQSRLDVLQQTPAQLATFTLSLAFAFDVSRIGTPIVAADPDDDIFLLCAALANAVYVVTNDKHLLALKAYREIAIVTIGQFFTREFNS